MSSLGNTQLQGDCPFCGSRVFRVRPEYGTSHCFGCGAGGNAPMFEAQIGRPRENPYG
ncbi:hypothetical protein DMC64_15405 [Amycolatopsis sp. WAC 04197]|nr:hypothetical protein DMC64_15405 [Amycolatopsis sp. WAC 04197]